MISSARSSFIAAFADELKRAREFNGISLSEVSEKTRVLLEYLEALESGRWESIPQPYLRGYLYLYAQCVGMNVEKVIKGYDDIAASGDRDGSATLDLTSPLLRQPEHIGVTRAKIRTGWFTALTRTRRLAYLVLAVSVLVLGTTLYVSRKSQRPHTTIPPFNETESDYLRTVRGPVTRLNLTSVNREDAVSSIGSKELIICGLAQGSALIASGAEKGEILRYMPYDTIIITYDSMCYITISPGKAAIVTTFAGDTLLPTGSNADSTFYASASASSPRPPATDDSTGGQ
jgi:transcriptional regulator with XRE-family HTH domain